MSAWYESLPSRSSKQRICFRAYHSSTVRKIHGERIFDYAVFVTGRISLTSFLKTVGIESEVEAPVLENIVETNIAGVFLFGDLSAASKGGSIIRAFNASQRATQRLRGGISNHRQSSELHPFLTGNGFSLEIKTDKVIPSHQKGNTQLAFISIICEISLASKGRLGFGKQYSSNGRRFV